MPIVTSPVQPIPFDFDTAIRAYVGQTARLQALVNFTASVGPSIGQTFESHQPLADDQADSAIVAARDHALVAAYKAIRSIANNS